MGKRNGNLGLSHGNAAEKVWRTQDFIMASYIFCYFLISLSFLTEFPFVHSDESWLSGLTRNMMEKGDLGVTETFFDLKPRHPHAIKILFHLLQMQMISLFGYGVFTFRLLSLLFSCVALILFYLLLKTVFPGKYPYGIRSGQYAQPENPPGYPLAGTVLLSLDVQFIYAGHFARQEILLVCCIIGCILAIHKRRWLIAGLITGLSVGLHPNSFLIGTMCAAMLLPSGENKARALNPEAWKPLLGYAGITAAFAGFFIGLSLSFDRFFFRHYWEYGSSEFDIGAPVTSKLEELPYFFEKIWYGVSGTYYVPDIRLELVLFVLAAAVASALLISGRRNRGPEKRESEPAKPESMAAAVLTLKGIAGMLAGMVIIGRYNQTGVIFLFPLCFLLVLTVIDSTADYMAARAGRSGSFKTEAVGVCGKAACAGGKASAVKIGSVVILAAAVAVSSYINISPWLKYSYEDYINEIGKAVTPQNKVLANLNCEYYFENGKLLDWRNLSYLKGADLSVEDYIRENKIEYIILSDEMDLIYSQRPVWNMIYGNLRYMEELHGFLDRNCTLVHSFKDNLYGVRIVRYMEPGRGSARDFMVQIFKVEDLS